MYSIDLSDELSSTIITSWVLKVRFWSKQDLTALSIYLNLL